ncbi:MAG: zinc ribbon domain-containing protein [Anaerolineae bacterium]|nr:zinc ribbon domain-containing protein [Anaerolineae bacterium]
MRCSKCGIENRQDAKFCNHCGYRFPVTEATLPGTPKKSRLLTILGEIKWILIIYVLLSLCCMSSVFFLGYRTNWILWKLGLR